MTSQWFDPLVLDEHQRQARETPPVAGGDFGSYALANRGGGMGVSGVEHHNLIYADHRIRQYSAVLGRRCHSFRRIADIGCGLGITTDALARHYPDARVIGFEVSLDAVEYARRTVRTADFIQMAISPTVPLPDTFDLILCQEFYAFTRTADRGIHQATLDHLRAHLAPGGVLLIELSQRDAATSILANSDLLPAGTSMHTLAFDRIYRTVPLFFPALLASILLSRLLSRPLNTCIAIRRSDGASL